MYFRTDRYRSILDFFLEDRAFVDVIRERQINPALKAWSRDSFLHATPITISRAPTAATSQLRRIYCK